MNITEDSSRLTLDEYQEQSAATDLEGSSSDPMVPLLGLGGEIGALLAEFKKKRRPDGQAYTGFDDVVVIELGDILWYLAALARRVRVPMSTIALLNLQKTRARWLPSLEGLSSPFDDGFPEGQRFPRRFTVVFSTYEDDRQTKVRIQISGEDFGDPTDDNARYADHYRFHDAFHLGYAAVLGWSPVLRSLLHRKRKADVDVDRIEDGARAAATEEAVAAFVFELAKTYNYFDGVNHIDEGILAGVRAVTARLEVGNRPASDWERAILSGFAVWRGLRDNDGGSVAVDLDARTVALIDN